MLAVLVAEPSRVVSFYQHVRKQGLRETIARISRVVIQDEVSQYREWIELYDTIAPREAEEIRCFVKSFPLKPKFSVLVPVFETPPNELIEMIASVRAQIYDDWELCLADDASKQPLVREILEVQAQAEPRIKLVFRQENGNISAASNSALALATGDFIALLDHDDILAPHALAIMADAINRYPDADILYSDEDKLDAKGRRYGAYFKPDWNPELLYGQNFVSHLGVYRTSLVRELGGFRVGFEGSQDYDLALRATAATAGKIVHVPHILYHWRVYPGAGTFTSTQMGRAVDTARHAIKEQLAGRSIDARVGDAGYNYHRVIRADPAVWPRVTIIVGLRQDPEFLSDCIEGLLDKTDYLDRDIVVVDAGVASRASSPMSTLTARGAQLVRSPNRTDFAKTINEAVRRASGEIVLFLDSDMSVVEPR
ncbi:MAG: glycosyltransferase, partial [Hyphomicrobiales bacterium]|nr:glycosyltransferase [Hyphomicrobiales bacterium]